MQIRRAGQPTEHIQLQAEEDRMEVLQQYFGLHPPTPDAAEGAAASTAVNGVTMDQAKLQSEVLATSEA